MTAAQEAFIRGAAVVQLYSATGEFVATIHTRVVDQITGLLPQTFIDVTHSTRSYIDNLQLTDPVFPHLRIFLNKQILVIFYGFLLKM